MVIQYVLDSQIIDMLPSSLIVSRQLACSASPRASLGRLRARLLLTQCTEGPSPLRSVPPVPTRLRTRSRASQERARGSSPVDCFPPSSSMYFCRLTHFYSKSLPLNLFADPHSLTPVASIFYKKAGGRGDLLVSSETPQPAQFRCDVSPLDATLLSPLLCVANKELTQMSKFFKCNTYKKHRGRGFVAQPFLAVLFHRSWHTEHRHSPYNGRSTSGEHTMHYRKFGRTGWNVSEIGYGMWGLAGWTGSDDAESLDALQRAVDLGCNFFDTAWAYGEGRSEQILGKVLRANAGKRLYVATKIPPKNLKWPSRRDFTLDDCYPPDHIE